MPNEQGNPIHAMIGFINLLSAETIDNTVAIQAQDPILVGHLIWGLLIATALWRGRDRRLRRAAYEQSQGGVPDGRAAV